MPKPKLLVALDGPIVTPNGVATYARPFMHWATQHFDVHFLTDQSPRVGFNVAANLGLPDDAVSSRPHGDLKTDALHPKEDFYWVDSIFLPGEMSWLAEHGRIDRAVSVDPYEGVTADVKARLERALRKR